MSVEIEQEYYGRIEVSTRETDIVEIWNFQEHMQCGSNRTRKH